MRFGSLSLAMPVLWLGPHYGVSAQPAAAAPASVSGSAGSLVSLGLGLLVVLAVIFACAWFVRRMNGLSGMHNQSMKVVSVMALGARERIALIDVGGQQILVGITPSAIRTLHVFAEPVVNAGEFESSVFAQRLQGLIGKK
ncbi:flagellar biosynthetic protein FliO [Marinobacter sp. X15-166B]|uniref:flagellar biosynthetic protein FliO n=1 Tax=Marinobacter sp. X15-166B TaxID=1897620 RepID=UPI00085C75B9|nr:flagellar biosynthetic protein FliO [Marinobacter sp. X15-166B]OEY67076.1 flagellar biosynthetic protein FliO [Marinobacter sp. X15-166B]